MKTKGAAIAKTADLSEQVAGLRDQRDFAISEVQRMRKQRDRALEALEFIKQGSRCVECGGEDAAWIAAEALKEIDEGTQ